MKCVVALVVLFAACSSAVPVLFRNATDSPLKVGVQIPRIVDTCFGKCPFIPKSAAFDVDPVPGGTVVISFTGLFQQDYPADGTYQCTTYVRVIFWIEAGQSEGDSCIPGGFKCPITADPINDQTEAQTLNVPSNAIKGSYYSHCTFLAGETVYADAEVYFTI